MAFALVANDDALGHRVKILMMVSTANVLHFQTSYATGRIFPRASFVVHPFFATLPMPLAFPSSLW
jgi:hypothetical protein